MMLVLKIGLFLAMVAGFWKVFDKAGQPGWLSLVPILNILGLLKIAGKPVWWIVLMFIPVVNIFAWAAVNVAVSRSFGKGLLYGLAMAVFPYFFYPTLGLGGARYLGPVD